LILQNTIEMHSEALKLTKCLVGSLCDLFIVTHVSHTPQCQCILVIEGNSCALQV